ncbi:MAG: hypothetical protein QOD42_2851 [Sphingomonadales bacterium]|nr:hypothetical protein [Sphingomonadales bacterium]
MQADFAQRLPGAIAMTAADLNGSRTRAEQEEQEERRKSERMMDAVGEVERQREEWARASHSFGATTMTGQQWNTLSAELEEGGAVRNWLLAQIMADGHTPEETRRIADRAQNAAEIMATPESQRTADERHELAAAERDPELRRYMGMAARHSRELHGPELARNEASASGSTPASVNLGAAAIEDFPNAPNLGAEFRTAQAAIAPLDIPRRTPSTTTAPTPQPVLASGFEV